jgi:hypothetical protein
MKMKKFLTTAASLSVISLLLFGTRPFTEIARVISEQAQSINQPNITSCTDQYSVGSLKGVEMQNKIGGTFRVLDLYRTTEIHRDGGNLQCSGTAVLSDMTEVNVNFGTKQINGKSYWYVQVR